MKINRRKFLQTAGFMGAAFGSLAINPARAYSRPSNLRITDIRGCTIASNYDYPIIRIYTNQGIEGLGEVRDMGYLGEALVLKPLLIGKDPLDIEGILESIRPYTGHGRAGGGYSAVDMALFDIAGKALGIPAYKIIGNKLRGKIAVYGDTDANADAAIYARRAKIRVQEFKLKHLKMDLRLWLIQKKEGAMANGIPTARGIEYWGEYVDAVREAIGPDVSLGSDHFGNMTVESGIMLGEAMAKKSRKMAYIEDVIGFRSPNAVGMMKQITEKSATPTLGYEDIFGFDGFRPFISQNAIAIIHCDMETSGGIMETKKIADYAFRFGIKTMFHHAGSPIGAMASVHCACTLRDFVCMENHAMDIPWWEDLAAGIEKPLIKDGCYTVPEKPGLGIELNDEEARKYLRDSQYLFKAGYFDPTPEFDQIMSREEAMNKRIISRNGIWNGHNGPWIHLDEEGNLVNRADPR
jgi:L-alanine-DL-glutamate epimerase-like enolase superfamily enzyme